MSDVIFCKDSVNITNTKMKMIGYLTLMGMVAFLLLKTKKYSGQQPFDKLRMTNGQQRCPSDSFLLKEIPN